MLGLQTRMALALSLLFGGFLALMSALLSLIGLSGMGLVLSMIALASLFALMQWAISVPLMDAVGRKRWLQGRGDHPFLWDTVHGLAREAGVGVERIGIDGSNVPNAYTYGRTSGSARVVVTRGLLERCTEPEIEAVIAHEIGHVKHRDMAVMTFISVIPVAAYWLARSIMWGGMVYGRERREEGAGAAPLYLFALLAFAFYLFGQLIVLLVSRIREYYADEFSSTTTMKPFHLASALARITYGAGLAPTRAKEESSSIRQFYICDPALAAAEMEPILAAAPKWDLDMDGILEPEELERAMRHEVRHRRLLEILATHPLTGHRIQRLRKLAREMGLGWGA